MCDGGAEGRLPLEGQGDRVGACLRASAMEAPVNAGVGQAGWQQKSPAAGTGTESQAWLTPAELIETRTVRASAAKALRSVVMEK